MDMMHALSSVFLFCYAIMVETRHLVIIYICIKTNVHLLGYHLFFYQKKEDGRGYKTVVHKRLKLPMKQFIFLKSCLLCDISDYLLCV